MYITKEYKTEATQRKPVKLLHWQHVTSVKHTSITTSGFTTKPTKWMSCPPSYVGFSNSLSNNNEYLSFLLFYY